MAYFIGTDEAGYGPNLGPLVIGASVWHVPGQISDVDLYSTLADVVVKHPTVEADRLAIADSKQLYRPGGNLAQLERGVLCLLAASGIRPKSCQPLRREVTASNATLTGSMPWHREFPISLPTSDSARLSVETIDHWDESCKANGVRLIGMRATILEPPEFNAGVQRYDSKGALLSNCTLDLVAEIASQVGHEPVRVVCDKHGGRNKYGSLLQSRFGGGLVQVVQEGRRMSVYRVGTERRPIEIRFEAGGESFMPSALASMLAKYLRELSMRSFNAFWLEQLPSLRPTAGYPVDARRFWKEIDPIRQRLDIDENELWRVR